MRIPETGSMLSSHDCSYRENQARSASFLQDTLLMFLGPSQGDLTQTHSTQCLRICSACDQVPPILFHGTRNENFIFFTSTSAPSYFFHDYNQFSSVQSLSRVQLFVTPQTTARQASLSITKSWSSPRLTFIESVMPSSLLILCRPLLLLPSIFPSIRVFSNESALRIRWPKYWSFSFNISPSSEHSGLLSFRMDWLDLLAVQGTLKSLLQHHSSKASILWRSAFFIVQLSHPYATTGKTIALTRRTFVGKVMYVF